jgi:hypothetical protein
MSQPRIRITSVGGSVEGPIGPTGPSGPKGDPAEAIAAMQYGSFYDLNTQTCTKDSIQAVYCNQTQFNNDIEIQNSSGGSLNASRLTLLNGGRYNIQFSLQMHQPQGGAIVNLWLSKNGNAVANSNTKFSITANNPYYVAAWNFFIDALEGDYYEIIWSSDNEHTVIEYVSPAGLHPAVPSVILTAHQIGV